MSMQRVQEVCIELIDLCVQSKPSSDYLAMGIGFSASKSPCPPTIRGDGFLHWMALESPL